MLIANKHYIIFAHIFTHIYTKNFFSDLRYYYFYIVFSAACMLIDD
jgi:hypothetical protein